MTKEQEFLSLLNSENADKLSEYIANNMVGNPTDDLVRIIEVDFNLQAGRMNKDPLKSTNTWIKFDTQENTLCRQILDLLCDEEVEPTEYLIESFEDFRELVQENLETKYLDTIKDNIKKAIFPNTPHQLFPLSDFKVNFFEIAEKPIIDYTLSIKKCAPKNEISTPISNELMQEHLRTNEDYMDIIKRKQEEGNEAYKYVTGIEKNKAFYEVNLDIYIDYSVDTSILENK